jgi:hypothetical protein
MTNLPAYLIIFGGLRSFVENFRAFRRISLFWLGFCLPFYWVCKAYVFHKAQPVDVKKFDLLLFKANVTPAFVLSIAMASMAVSWHRHILNNTRPRIVLDHAAWHYWWNGVAIVLMTLIVMIPILVPVSAVGNAIGSTGTLSKYLGIVASSVVLSLISYRLSLKLPAQAIGRKPYGFKQSWRDTKGESLQFVIIGAVVACVGNLVVKVEEVLDHLATRFDSYVLLILGASVDAVLDLAFAGLGIAMLTYSYVYFAEGREM